MGENRHRGRQRQSAGMSISAGITGVKVHAIKLGGKSFTTAKAAGA